MPLDESLHIARQIAEAVEAAHEKGVIHRDLKPANVKITPEGAVMVLDFGLAKAADDSGAPGDPSSSPTLTAQATQAGMIMGTAAYMAPEQARGHVVDKRADIWSFGAMLFEMLTGQRAFVGETTSDVLASVLKFDPDWNALPASTPPSIVRLLRRCLTTDRKQRLQAIGEARIVIDETVSGDVAAGLTRHVEKGGVKPLLPIWRRALPWLVAVGLTLIVGVAAGWWASTRRNPPTSAWSGQRLGGPSVAMGPRVSPDGHTLAFQAMVDGLTQVAVMDADDRIVKRLDGVPGSEVTDLAASPDQMTLYYVASRTVWAIAASGGQPRYIGPGDAIAADPNGKDLIVQLIEQEGIWLLRVQVSGGTGEPIPIQSTLRLASVLISPHAVGKDGRVVLSVATPDSWFYGAAILDSRSGKWDRVPLNFTGDLLAPGWLEDGRILTSAWPLKSTLWRFRPAASGKK
jgi:serine/threonine-protein kinase